MQRAARESEATQVLTQHLDGAVTGRLDVEEGGVGLAVYVMNGQVVAATSEDDPRELIRRLDRSGHLPTARAVELDAMALLGEPVFGLLLEEVEEAALEEVLYERFRDNLARFLAATRVPRFTALSAVFVDNLQLGHDVEELLGECLHLAEAAATIALDAWLRPEHPEDAVGAQKLVLAALSPGRTVRQVIAELPLEPLFARAMVARMVDTGVLALAGHEGDLDESDAETQELSYEIDETEVIDQVNQSIHLGDPSRLETEVVTRWEEEQPEGDAPSSEGAPVEVATPEEEVDVDEDSPTVDSGLRVQTLAERLAAMQEAAARIKAKAKEKAKKSRGKKGRAEPEPEVAPGWEPDGPEPEPEPEPEASLEEPEPDPPPEEPEEEPEVEAEPEPEPEPEVAPGWDEPEPEPEPVPEPEPEPEPEPSGDVVPTEEEDVEDEATARRNVRAVLGQQAPEDLELDMDAFADHDQVRGGEATNAGGVFSAESHNLERVEVASLQPSTELDEEEELIEVDEAPHAKFGARALTEDEALKKIEVANEAVREVIRAFDASEGSGSGRATVQILLDGSPQKFAALFAEVRLDEDDLPPHELLRNLHQRPLTEHRQLLNNGLVDLIERALSLAMDEITDDQAIDTLLEKTAGYRQRIGL